MLLTQSTFQLSLYLLMNWRLTCCNSDGEIVKHVQASEATGKVAPVDSFRSMTFSKDGSLLATTGDDKELKVWDTEAWTENSTRPVLKRINALHFTNDGTQVVEADKFGDVYSYVSI